MAKKKTEAFEDLPMVLTVDDVQDVAGMRRTKALEVFHSVGFPRLRILTRNLVLKDSFLKWYEENKEVCQHGNKTASQK